MVSVTACKGLVGTWATKQASHLRLKKKKQYLKLVKKTFLVAALRLSQVKYCTECWYKVCFALTVVHLAKSTHCSLPYLSATNSIMATVVTPMH